MTIAYGITYPFDACFAFNDYLIFTGNSGNGIGYEPWIIYSNTQTLSLLMDINPSNSSSVYSINSRYFEYNNKIFFGADDGINGCELWCTDLQNTYMVSDISPGSQSSNPDPIIIYQNYLYFSATNYQISLYQQLYKTDGINIIRIKEIFTLASPTFTNNWRYFAIYHNKLYFTGADYDNAVSGNYGLWVTEGTEVTTKLVTYKSNIPYVPCLPREFVVYNDALYFTAADGTHEANRELFKLYEI